MRVTHPICIFGLLLTVTLGAGCRSFDAARVRQEQTDTFTSNLAARAEAELAQPLSLADCVRIAMSNNYAVRKADLDQELYRIGKNVAFTAFLPNVAAQAGYTSFAKDPKITEREFATAGVDIGMPIFMPSTWFLYAAARQGYAASGIAAHYVRQGIVLQTTVNYYNVLVQQDMIAALESQVAAAQEMASRARGLAAEGLAANWEGDQAELAAQLRQTELNHARRQMAVLRGELLKGLGLSPTAEITLSGETGDPVRPDGDVADLVLTALATHPELSLADRQVVIKEEQVRQAFCAFLPTLSLFHNGTWTGNELAAHSVNWTTGFGAAWTVFDGFANRARYRAAKVERRQAELARESTFLSIIVGVVAAEAAVHDATEAAAVKQRAYEVTAAKVADYKAKAREGLIPLSDALDAQVLADLAQVALVQSRYQERIALANLELAMGLTLVPDLSSATPSEK